MQLLWRSIASGSPPRDNQNTAQHFAIASASARKPRRETDTQDQTHAEDRHGELIIAGGEKNEKRRKGTGGDERSYTTQVGCCSQDLWSGCASGRLRRASPRWIFLRWERRIMSLQSLSKCVAFVCGLVDDGELERSARCGSCCAAIAFR